MRPVWHRPRLISAAVTLFRRAEHRHSATSRVSPAVRLVDFRPEDSDTMCDALSVHWTVRPVTTPRPWLACSSCGQPKPFRSSERFRLNANGRRLDAWLIYRCVDCDATWNRPLFERRPLRSIDPDELGALQANAPDLAMRAAFDLAALRRHTARIDENDHVVVDKALVQVSPLWQRLDIAIAAPLPTALRLDRLLAAELPLSRSEITVMAEDSRLNIEPDDGRALRKRLKDATRIIIERPAASLREDWYHAATGQR